MTSAARVEASRDRREDSKMRSETIRVLKEAVASAKIEGSLLEQAEIEEHRTEGVAIMLVRVPHQVIKELRRNFEITLSRMEELFPSHAVFIVRQRMPSGLKQGGKRRVGPTKADYQESVVRDLVMPGNVIDRRTTVRSDGARLEKIFVDKGSEQALENRLESMGLAFESLFKKQAIFRINYY